MGNDTSLIIPVVQAAFIQPFRELYLHRPGVTMPPHVTVRVPFKQIHELSVDDYHTLAKMCASVSAFSFSLARLARFTETGILYLEPEPTEPFMNLHQALFTRYPEPADKHPNVVFHLTLAKQEATVLDWLETEFSRSYGALLPIRAVATEMNLYEKRDERWFKEESFPFGQSHVA